MPALGSLANHHHHTLRPGGWYGGFVAMFFGSALVITRAVGRNWLYHHLCDDMQAGLELGYGCTGTNKNGTFAGNLMQGRILREPQGAVAYVTSPHTESQIDEVHTR
jgi:hypothetical protein